MGRQSRVDFVVTPPPSAPPITSGFSITASSPPLSPHWIGGLSLVLQDFRINVSPQNQVTSYTGTGWNPATLVYFITATGINGFNGNISLTFTNQGHVPCVLNYGVTSSTLTVASIVNYTVNMGTCTVSPNWYPMVDIDGQSGGVHRTATAGIGLNESAPESISAPSISLGASSGSAGMNYTYTANGGASSFGHAVEYQFNWGDGTSSPWFGAPVATHAWSGTAVYTVSVQARCATDPSVVSPLSSGYTVNLTGSTTYTISGQVQQPDGSGIGGTILAARDWQNTLVTTVISDTSGNYALSLPAGSYSVTATSPFGALSPATLSYDLFGHRPGENRRLATMNFAPEIPPQDHGPERNYVPVPNTGAPTTYEFWYMGVDDDARNTSSCRVSPADGVAVQFNRPTDADRAVHGNRYFTITFTAQPTAALGHRDIICRYGNQDIVGITGITVYDGTPHIDSISPAYGIAGFVTGFTVSGSNLDDVTSVKISGNSCPGPQCLLSASVAGEITTATVPVSISIDAAALSGTYQVTVVSTMLESNPLPYTVADKPPMITNVTQTALQPGEPGTIVIYGQNFGTCPAGLPCGGARVTSCLADASTCTSTDLTGSVTSWSSSEITLTLSASATSAFTPGEYQLQVTSAGIAGQGFVSTPQTGSISNRGNFVMNSNPNVTLEVRSETSVVPELTPGNQNTTASCAWITPTPSMPSLTVKVNGGTAAGTVSYRLETLWSWNNRDVQTGLTWPETVGPAIPQSGVLSMSGDSVWTVPWPTNCGPSGNSPCFYGGWATLRWLYQAGPQQPATYQAPYVFKICGQNPTVDTALQYIDSVMPDPTKYWFAEKMALHETAVSEFCQSGRTTSPYCSKPENQGWPVLGPPAGYGILQRDPLPKTQVDLPEQIMWNWKTAVTSGKDHIDATAGQQVEAGGGAYGFWMRQVRQWKQWNDGHPNDRKSPPADVPYYANTDLILNPATSVYEPISPQAVPTCIFKFSVDQDGIAARMTIPSLHQQPFTAWFGDAILIKRFNGATADFLSWKNTGPDNDNPFWKLTPENGVSNNTVKEVCSCTGPTRNCLPSLAPKYGRK